MTKSGLELMPGEKMILFSHPHWWYFWKQVVGAVVIIAVFILAVWLFDDGFFRSAFNWIAVIGLVLLVLDTVYELIQWRTTRFAVTDQRVAYQSGFFRRRGVSIPLNRVNNVNFEQSFIARLTGNGVVTIESAGETGDSVFQNIPDPDNVRSIIFKQMSDYDAADSDRDAAALAKAMRDQSTGAPLAPPTAPASSVQDRLAELDALRSSGVISDEEYTKKRDDILGSL
jgi:uncharacterized membrane protein YdbT with pleckstrin-like domain